MRGQRQGDTLDAKNRVARICGNQDLAQGRVDRWIAGNEPAADLAHEVGGLENGIAGGVGMDDLAVDVDQDHAGAQPIEDIRKAHRLGLLEIDGLADQQCATNVGYQQRHAPAHFIVDQTARFVPNNTEKRATCRRFLDHHARDVDPAMWPRPLAIKAAPAKFVMGYELRSTHDLLYAEVRQVRGGVEFRIALRIDLEAVRIGPDITVQILGFTQGMLREKASRLTAAKRSNFLEDVAALCGVERGVVNITNKRRKLFFIVHGC